MADLFQTLVRNFKLGDCRRHCNSGWGGRSREINVMFRHRWLIALAAIAAALVPVIADARARAGFGIGIAHGFATLGTIGFEGRFDYAAIGTVSNVASRLCDEAKPGQILISPRVFTAVKDAVAVEPVGEFALKGIARPLAAYNVLSAKSAS
jgi:class 3 adenylate cyclase